MTPEDALFSVLKANNRQGRSKAERLALFDQATERQRRREANPDTPDVPAEPAWKPHEIARGWRREDLYTRGRTR